MIPTVTPSALRARRLGFVAANLLLYAGLLAALVFALGGSMLGWLAIVCFAMFSPWSVLGFTTGLVGLVLLLRDRKPPRSTAAIGLRTAVVMTLRNEDPSRALQRLRIVRDSLDATGAGDRFACFVLSDSSDPAIIAREEAEIAAWPAGRVVYRRRAENTGFKAGNLMEFCENQGAAFDLMIPLDADSLMSGPAILDLVRIMQDNPDTGIVQGLVVGLPASSVFARMFQFGMRHGMRSYTVGQAWWTHDCGPFWGHNAILRIAPFVRHCRLPVLSGAPPFGGHILSHDQIEAVLMRRAGFNVRLHVVAGGSWEDNPPTILDYISRDTRWCQGNLQYLRLLGMTGLHAVSRFQLVWAVLMFAGLPAFTLLLAPLPVLAVSFGDLAAAQVASLRGVYWLYLMMYLAPKLVGYLHTAWRGPRCRRYGGRLRFALGAVAEILFSFLQSSITSFHTAIFIITLGLGRSTSWSGQARDARSVSWRQAVQAFWPQTIFGAFVNGGLFFANPAMLVYALPFTLGTLIAIPFAVATASPTLGSWCVRLGLCDVPEDRAPPPEVAALTKGSAG